MQLHVFYFHNEIRLQISRSSLVFWREVFQEWCSANYVLERVLNSVFKIRRQLREICLKHSMIFRSCGTDTVKLRYFLVLLFQKVRFAEYCDDCACQWWTWVLTGSLMYQRPFIPDDAKMLEFAAIHFFLFLQENTLSGSFHEHMWIWSISGPLSPTDVTLYFTKDPSIFMFGSITAFSIYFHRLGSNQWIICSVRSKFLDFGAFDLGGRSRFTRPEIYRSVSSSFNNLWCYWCLLI